MTLPSSGAISLSDIRTELSASGTISLNDTNVRTLSGKTTPSSTEIMPIDFYGKSAGGGGAPPPSPGAGCVIEGTKLTGLSTIITSGVATVTGRTSGGTVWGDNSYGYTSDSDFARAAVHAGILTAGQTGYVSFTSLGDKPGPFPGTTSNGVTTTYWPTNWCAVTLAASVVSPSSTYSFSSITTSINEGSSGTYGVSTTSVSSGTNLYWTVNHITTSNADFASDRGSLAIFSDVGSFIVSTIGDNTTEGAQTFTISIRTGSYTGPVVNTSSTITINDTSQGVPATVPGAPTIGVARSTGATSATVDFTAPASNGGAAITSYTAVSSPEGITGTLSQSGSGTITINGLTSSTPYTFTVYATNSVGNSPSSASSNQITTSAVPTVPGAPIIGIATKTGSTSATVSYTAPANNGGATITSYTAIAYLYPSGTSAGITGTLNQAGNGIITVTGLSPSTSYTFKVKATNSVGDSNLSGATSNITTDAATVLTVPPTPTIGAAISTGQTTATVSFTAPYLYGAYAITSYTAIAYLYPSGTSAGITGSVVESGGWGSINISGLTSGTSYTFKVKATNATGDSNLSADSNFITTTAAATVPGVPTIGAAIPTGQTTATVSYTAPTSDGGSVITSYTAQAYSYPSGTATGITNTLSQSGDGVITVSGLTASTSYTFKVRATNSVGNGSYSADSASMTTNAISTVPGAPTITGAVATGQTTADVSFSAPASNGGSPITSYTILSSPGGITSTLNQSGGGTFNVTGLTAGTSYTFTIKATNSVGDSSPSSASSSITTASAGPALGFDSGDSFSYLNDQGNLSPTSMDQLTDPDILVVIRRQKVQLHYLVQQNMLRR
jgi:hypothetical protein